MKHRYLAVFLSLVAALAMLSCGGSTPGAPGSPNDIGVIISATIDTTENGYSVDAFQQVCNAGPPPEYEQFTDHGVAVSITGTLLSPDLKIEPGALFVEGYTVEYRRSSDSVGAPPILEFAESRTFEIPTNGSMSTTVLLVDLTRKIQYAQDMMTGQFTSANGTNSLLNNYTAIYTFYGHNIYGKPFTFTATLGFQIGPFDNC